MSFEAICSTSIPGMTPKKGKVRDVYDFGDALLLVSTDRLSAFDWILPTGIPDKGKILNQVAAFWFDRLGVPNHLITTDVSRVPFPAGTDIDQFAGRSAYCKKTKVIPIECVVRGYLSGGGWKEYQRSGSVCGVQLPTGLRESEKLPTPIFTPSTKAETGHDENISFEETVKIIGASTAETIRAQTLDIFSRGCEYAASRGIIIADTKFEFGVLDGKIILIDEVMTPDSSRFWPSNRYEPGRGQESFDKQFVRDWLLASDWDRNSPPPALPDDIVERTRAKYVEAFEKLTGKEFHP